MIWELSWRADPEARRIADRHYSRQSPGSAQFVPPGRCLVLKTRHSVWVTSWPFAEYVKHAWAGAWVCSCFRREDGEDGPVASEMIRQAVAATRWRWSAVPGLGMVSFCDQSKVRHKRDVGRCFKKAGFKFAGWTKGKLLVWRMAVEDMPDPEKPIGIML